MVLSRESRWCWTGSLVAAAMACQSTAVEPAGADTATGPTNLGFDLPPTLGIVLDGEALGPTPGTPMEVEAGEHEVKVVTPCGEATGTVTALEGETVMVTENTVGLQSATLTITTVDREGKVLTPTLWLDEWPFVLDGAGQARVPACNLRLRLGSPTRLLGGFMEDIDFKPDTRVRRDLVLLPGPDRVRIKGGRFYYGMSKDLVDTWEPKRSLEDVATFELDRTEVTAAQYRECFREAGCDADGAPLGLRWPSDGTEQCTLKQAWDGYFKVRAKPGKRDHPATCVTPAQAERYCEWAGKRLVTNVEWEYAARGRGKDIYYPWGNEETSLCPAHGGDVDGPVERVNCEFQIETVPVCSYAIGNSEQGICDMIGNAGEMVAYRTPERLDKSTPWHLPKPTGAREKMVDVRGGSYARIGRLYWDEAWMGVEQLPHVGFRCARTAGGGPAEGPSHD